MRKGLNEINLDQLPSETKESLSTVWFTADYHAGHWPIIQHTGRPKFSNIEEHDEWLLNEVHNKYVSKNDRIYMLGDISMAKRKEAQLFLGKLKGKKFMILGNHDKNIYNAPQFVKIDKTMDFRFKEFDLDLNIFLCHYPMMSWNKSYHGSWSLYGHVHGRLKHPYLGLDVGIDNDDIKKYRPINLIEIIEWMQKKKDLIGKNKLNN